MNRGGVGGDGIGAGRGMMMMSGGMGRGVGMGSRGGVHDYDISPPPPGGRGGGSRTGSMHSSGSGRGGDSRSRPAPPAIPLPPEDLPRVAPPPLPQIPAVAAAIPPIVGGGGAQEAPCNDAEIVIIGKSDSLDLYAESIEGNIKSVVELTVDLMYPKPDVKLTDFIQALAKRGTKFAVVIRQENQERRSVSLYVLKATGAAKELRNMPLDSAYKFMKEEIKKLRREAVGRIPPDVKGTLQGLLNYELFKDKQYQGVIKYVMERWRLQHEYEQRTTWNDANARLISAGAINGKIQHILGVVKAEAGVGGGEPPSIQQAIHNLLNDSNILKVLQGQPKREPLPPPEPVIERERGGPPKSKLSRKSDGGSSISSGPFFE